MALTSIPRRGTRSPRPPGVPSASNPRITVNWTWYLDDDPLWDHPNVDVVIGPWPGDVRYDGPNVDLKEGWDPISYGAGPYDTPAAWARCWVEWALVRGWTKGKGGYGGGDYEGEILLSPIGAQGSWNWTPSTWAPRWPRLMFSDNDAVPGAALTLFVAGGIAETMVPCVSVATELKARCDAAGVVYPAITDFDNEDYFRIFELTLADWNANRAAARWNTETVAIIDGKGTTWSAMWDDAGQPAYGTPTFWAWIYGAYKDVSNYATYTACLQPLKAAMPGMLLASYDQFAAPRAGRTAYPFHNGGGYFADGFLGDVQRPIHYSFNVGVAFGAKEESRDVWRRLQLQGMAACRNHAAPIRPYIYMPNQPLQVPVHQALPYWYPTVEDTLWMIERYFEAGFFHVNLWGWPKTPYQPHLRSQTDQTLWVIDQLLGRRRTIASLQQSRTFRRMR